MIKKKNLILVLAGGIGNQLFMYATGKRLAEKNDARLLLDHYSGFEGDTYKQASQLDKFTVSAAEAPHELRYNNRGSRLLRSAAKRVNRWLPYDRRWLVLENTDRNKMTDFDPRLLNLRLSHRNSYLIDYFQCELYFKDIRSELLKEFEVSSPFNSKTLTIADLISSKETPVAVHARQLRGAPNIPGVKAPEGLAQKSFLYYEKAINYMINNLNSPHFFCFGDDPDWFKDKWNYNAPATFVSHNNGQEEAVQDLHLIRSCKHFIIGNSTFSWWPAWLSENEGKIVIAPANSPPDIWSGNKDVIPSSWRTVS